MGLKLANNAFNSYVECKSALQCWNQTWTALAVARSAGSVRNIGVSNFITEHLDHLLTLPIVQTHPVAVNQIPFNPWVPQWQRDLVTYCSRYKISVTGYFNYGGSAGGFKYLDSTVLKEISKTHGV